MSCSVESRELQSARTRVAKQPAPVLARCSSTGLAGSSPLSRLQGRDRRPAFQCSAVRSGSIGCWLFRVVRTGAGEAADARAPRNAHCRLRAGPGDPAVGGCRQTPWARTAASTAAASRLIAMPAWIGPLPDGPPESARRRGTVLRGLCLALPGHANRSSSGRETELASDRIAAARRGPAELPGLRAGLASLLLPRVVPAAVLSGVGADLREASLPQSFHLTPDHARAAV